VLAPIAKRDVLRVVACVTIGRYVLDGAADTEDLEFSFAQPAISAVSAPRFPDLLCCSSLESAGRKREKRPIRNR